MKKIVVIGSGLAGSLICNALAETCDVTLLEIGDKNKIGYPRVNFSNKHFGAVKTFCTGAGGTTNLWDNGLIPIKPEDVTSKPFNRMLQDSQPYMDSAATALFFKTGSYTAEYQAVLARMTAVAHSMGVFSDGVDCLIYPKKHKGLAVNGSVHAIYNAVDLQFEVQARCVASVKFNTGGDLHSLHPDVLIVCAGALGTPKVVDAILQAAGHRTNHVGVGLADHPMGFVGKIKVKKEYRNTIRQMSYHDNGDYIYRTAVRLKSDCGRYTGCVFFRPALSMQNDLAIYKYKSLLGASKGKNRVRNAFSPKMFHPDILAEIYSHLTGRQVQSSIFNLLVLFEQKRGFSRVSYAGGNIDVDWCVSDEELSVYNQILKKLHHMLSNIADDLTIQMPLTEDWLWSAAHHSGTIACGASPDGLVGGNLKLNETDNVFVCDGSVIQEHSYANTGLTIAQLATNLAERLKSLPPGNTF